MMADALGSSRLLPVAEGTSVVTTLAYSWRTLRLWKRRIVARHLVSRRDGPSPRM